MEVIVAMGNRYRSFGGFRGRVRLHRSAPGDMSLVIDQLQLNDTGRYRCEVIDGLEDESVTVELKLQGNTRITVMSVFMIYSWKALFEYLLVTLFILF